MSRRRAGVAGRSEFRRAVSDAEKSQRRQVILAAAKQVFSSGDFHAATMADIARAAGVSYGTLYWYFDSKDELFDALMDEQEAALRHSIDSALKDESVTDVESALQSSVRAVFDFFDADREASKLLFRDATAISERFTRHLLTIFDRFLGDLEYAVSDAQRKGMVRDAPPRVVAYAAASLIGQLAYRRLSTDDGLSSAEAAEFVVSLLLDGLRPR
ncbi:MAG: HTH-type transcriptional regulator BetI [Acidimicrobiales bacterium]|nr:HTH-type transcriptional regulator BetI [Acidimicrobiales bacterium]